MAQDNWLDLDVIRSLDIDSKRKGRKGGSDRIQRLRALGQERLREEELDRFQAALKIRKGEVPYPTREEQLQTDPHQKHLREDRLKRLREERATRGSGSGGRGGPFRPPTGFPEDDEDPDDILVIVQAILDTVGWTQSKKIREIKTLLGVGGRRPRGFSK